MIEGGKAGASALALAAQRRAEVERLVVEAQHYEAVAADERIMAAQLATLPPIFVILHDLKVPDSPETADHVVVGPGGAFLIVTRRCLDSVEFRDGELWSGGRSLKSEIDGARVISALLTRTLVTPVVPVVGFVGAGVPIGTPTVVQGVIVCAADGVARVVTRATHTHLLAHEFAQVVQRAVPLLSTAVSVERHDPAVRSVALAPPTLESSPSVSSPSPVLGSPTPTHADTGRSTTRGRHWWQHLGAVAAVGVGLVVLTIAAGVLVKTLRSGNANGSGRAVATTVEGPATTTPFVSGPLEPTLAADVSPPLISFNATCPTRGDGWTLTPSWPGDLNGLAAYEVEVRDLKGPWHRLGSFTRVADLADGALMHQRAGQATGVRITAVMLDGSRSANEPVIIAAPKTSC